MTLLTTGSGAGTQQQFNVLQLAGGGKAGQPPNPTWWKLLEPPSSKGRKQRSAPTKVAPTTRPVILRFPDGSKTTSRMSAGETVAVVEQRITSGGVFPSVQLCKKVGKFYFPLRAEFDLASSPTNNIIEDRKSVV